MRPPAKEPAEHLEIRRQLGGLSAAGTGAAYVVCPFCEGRGAKKVLRVKLETGHYKCFRCEAWGRLALEGAVDYLPPAGRNLPPAEVAWPREAYPLAAVRLMPSMRTRLAPAIDYLERRGVSLDTAIEVGIGYVEEGFYAGRVLVPVRDRERLVGWSARDITGESTVKYLYPRGMQRERLMFGMNALRLHSHNPVLCVEGVFDALPYWPNVAAFLGKPAGNHFELLRRAHRPVVICLDGDAWGEGQATAFQLALLEPRLTVGCIRLPPKTDPNTVDHAQLRRAAWHALMEWPSVHVFSKETPQ